MLEKKVKVFKSKVAFQTVIGWSVLAYCDHFSWVHQSLTSIIKSSELCFFDGINSSGPEMDPTLTEQNIEAIVKNTTKNVNENYERF